jgi:O-acetyl-ADP-ribose deacetylase (regulator of RNase III)
MIPSRTSEYKLNNTIFRVSYGDITKVEADVLVSSDDNYLSMGGGVSRALLHAAGETLRKEAKKHVPLKIGDVAVTSAGDLAARYVFHAVTIDYTNMIYSSQESVQSATFKCLQRADILGVRSIAFPALGTGAAGFPFQLAADTMTRTIADYLMGDTKIDVVTLSLFPRQGANESNLNLFYERAAALASIYTQSKRLNVLFDELDNIIIKLNKPNLCKQLFMLKSELQRGQEVLSEQPENMEKMEQIHSISNLNNTSEKFINITSEVNEWTDKQQKAKVMRIKLDGFYARLNIQINNLNAFEIEKAKYAGQMVPRRLENDIEDTRKEIENVENEIKLITRELATQVTIFQ